MKNQIECPDCQGHGYTSEHDDTSFDHEGQHCCSNCPVQAQCETCQATGKIQDQEENEIIVTPKGTILHVDETIH